MHRLIVLRGNSGSGKTTVAKELQKLFGDSAMLISQDVIRREILNVKDGENTPAIPLLMELLRYGRNHNEVVILEGILVADWYRPIFELAEELFGANIYAYYFDISFEETLRRHQTRPSSNEFGEEVMRSWWKENDYSDILNEIKISENQSKDEIVQVIYEAVSKNPYKANYHEQKSQSPLCTETEKDVAKNSVSMNVRRLVDNKLYLTISNQSDEIFTYGSSFNLLKNAGDGYEDVVDINDIIWTMELYSLAPGDEVEIVCDLSIFGDIRPGAYRIMKGELVADFVIDSPLGASFMV